MHRVVEVNERRAAWDADLVSEPGVIDVLSTGPEGPRAWLPVPDVAELLGVSPGRVRRLVQERALAGLRRDKVFCIPAELIKDGEPLTELQGTLVLLADSGFSDEEALRWLFTDDDYPGTPIDALRSGRGKTEVRRRAQALAF